MGTAGIDGLSVWGGWNPDGSFHIEGKLAEALRCEPDAILPAFTDQLDAIVTTGERRWLTEHGIESALWVA